MVSLRLSPVLLSVFLIAGAALGLSPQDVKAQTSDAPENVIFIISDDHRHDFMGFHDRGPDFLKTPAFDRMAREGAHLKNAFVTTSLCSPSRASILTGKYAHNHGVVSNSTPIPDSVRFFPEFVQDAGYNTAFIGKWHMGHQDASPRRGFDRWVSFPGQGVYDDPTFNVDGEKVEREGYMTDLLTDYAIDWLGQQKDAGDPFILYLSHKAVHAEFEPADRHEGTYADLDPPRPPTMANTEANYRGKPEWVKEQRYSWHGVSYMYHGDMTYDTLYRNYAETLLALDESIGRVLDHLERTGLAENTLVIYMGDNGFLLGEHGLIDKRNAYEPSIRVPILAWSPGFIEPGTTISSLIRNIDVAPTIFEATGASSDRMQFDGTSFLDRLKGEPTDRNRSFLYEYYWEHAFPHTPTTFALRGDTYKYIYYHGIWDQNELYNLENDPREEHNLIDVPAQQARVDSMRNRLFDCLEAEDAMQIPLRRGDWQADERLRDDR
jgi:N-acetylglucosamine-6-sulfatase